MNEADQKIAKKVDKQDMYSQIKKFGEQLVQAYKMSQTINLKAKYNQIYIAGMGGSAIAAFLAKEYAESLDSKTPINVINQYELPSTADKNSLIIINSYSGNTEEVLAVYKEARKKGLPTLCIASGGKLKTYCDEEMTDFFLLPRGIQPRVAVPYLFAPVLRVLELNGSIPPQQNEITLAAEMIKNPALEEKARNLAENCFDKLPVIYASNRLRYVAYRWKTNINENAKMPAYCHYFPELNHNEMNGFENLPEKVQIVILKEKGDHIRNKKRMDITKSLLTKKGIGVSEIELTGPCFLANTMAAMHVGDLLSYFLALKYNTDPTPVDIVEEFKKQMGK